MKKRILALLSAAALLMTGLVGCCVHGGQLIVRHRNDGVCAPPGHRSSGNAGHFRLFRQL